MIAVTSKARVNRSTRAKAQAPKLRLKTLSVGTDAKTVKGFKLQVCTAILYLAPADSAGRGNLCPHASTGCRAACLFTAGRGKFDNVRTARINKTLRWFDDRRQFLADIVQDITKLEKYCKRHGLTPAVRLNGTSDIPWENVILPDDGCNLMELFPAVKFYDYTKNPHRAIKSASGRFPANYSLCFSRSELNQADCARVLRAGGNVSVVYSASAFAEFAWDNKGQSVPVWKIHNGGKLDGVRYQEQQIATLGNVHTVRVFNGDLSDVRFYDPKGVVVALKAKGDARGDSSGFVVN